MKPTRQKVGLYTLGLALILLGSTFLLRNTAYAYLWNPPVLGACLLILLGLEFIITKIAVDRSTTQHLGVSVISIVLISLMLLSMFGVGVVTNIMEKTPFSHMMRWGMGYVKTTPVYHENHTYSQQQAQQYANIHVQNNVGNIIILPSTDNELHIQADYFSNRYQQPPAQQILPDMIQQQNDTLTIQMDQNDRVDITLSIPQNITQLVLSNDAGRTQVSDVACNISVSHTLGEIMLNDISGNVEAESSGGKINMHDIDGNVEVTRASLGKVTITSVTGHANVFNQTGDVTLDDIKKDATVQVNTGNATLRNVHGNIKAEVTTGNLSISSSKAVQAKVHTGNLTYTAQQTEDLSIEAHARFGKIQAASIYGTPQHEATSESLKTTFGDGTIKVELSSSTGNIRLK